MREELSNPEAVAVIGMAGRFPGAANPDEFWENLIAGKDCVSRFPGRSDSSNSKYVGARGILDDVSSFDASFFGIYPKEAELMDPQHRVFLECSWEALEDAGYDPANYQGMIGVYTGLSLNTYLLHNLGKGKELASNYQVSEYQTMLGNDKDFLPVRVSYKLDLRGPSMAIQSACSTSLVAICQAATALLTYQCDMALSGGVSISFPQQRDYLYQEEGMVSPDGTCRAFDANAAGTVFGHGCGVVLLKRLSDAIADKDPILAVLRGWAVNNDGSEKIGFAAPGLNAQAEVISMAQAAAGVHPSEISYVEAHGTGTPLGDPIEVAALTKAFREGGAEANGFCSIGTGKTHIGHLDCAAGVTGLIKTIQQFKHGKIPALLHYQEPNPRIDFAGSPFSPVSETRDWNRGSSPRIAGISAFGVGGTNAHIIVEEPPSPKPAQSNNEQQLFVLSAKSQASLDGQASRLANFLDGNDVNLADVSYTLATGRKRFPYRRILVGNDRSTLVSALRGEFSSPKHSGETLPLAFLFPGQGSQYVGMGHEIYIQQTVFRKAVDTCATILIPLIGQDIRHILYPSADRQEQAEQEIHRTALTQPSIFVVEYALAKLWMSWGYKPSLLVGHSIGEYVAAVLSGVFTLEDALRLLSIRALLMQNLPSGAMLAVRAGATEIHLPADIDLAADNSPKLCTVSGTHEAIDAYQQELQKLNIGCKKLNTSHAFHSFMMEPMLEEFTRAAAEIPTQTPRIPWISTCTGDFVTAETLSDPAYWSRQLRHSVKFTDAMETAFRGQKHVMLEVGPGRALGPFALQHPSRGEAPVISTLPSSEADMADLLTAAGDLWKQGLSPDWDAFYSAGNHQRIHLPTYAFEKQIHWIDNSSESSNVILPPASLQTVAPSSPSPIAMNTDRTQDLAATLRSLVLDLSGIAVTDDSASFTELGFDSLFLTQASQAILSRFGVKITFRQMLGDLSSVASLAAYLNKELPATAVAATPAAPAATAVAPVQTQIPGASNLEQLIANNIQIMQALLADRQASVPAPAPTASPSNGLEPVKWPVDKPRDATAATRFGPYKPIEKGENGGLTDLQSNSLQKLIDRYISKTPASKAYTAEHRPHFADPRAVSGFKSQWKEMVYPIVSSKSKGGRIWDIDGNEYVDITMGFGTYFFGHSPDWLIDAIQNQLHTGIEIGPQSAVAGKLAKAIAEMTGMDRVTFCNTGSEAVMAAMRLARTITGRNRIAYFTGDYHGMFEEVLVRGAWIDGIYKPQPVAPGIPQSLVDNILVLDYADPTSLDILRAHAHELAAVMVEPVQSRAPGLQPRDFMHEVRAITRKSGSALIFDEVVTGFRCAPGGAQAYFGVEADLATYGKVIGGGMPIGVLAGKKEYMDALDGGAWNYGDDSFPEVGVTFFAGTFVRHPLALAAAWRVVQHLMGEGPRLQIDMEERVSRLCRTLNQHFEVVGVPIRIPHFSAYAVIEHAPDLKYASLLWYFLREKGIHVWEGRPLYFTTGHTDEDLDAVVKGFVAAVAEMQASGFLPGSSATSTSTPDAFPRFDSAPTTEAQREIFHAVLMGDEANCSFNESNVIRLDGELDRAALKSALADLVTRHPALRSTFSEDGTTQFFHPSTSTVEVMEHDFSDITGSPSSHLPLSLIKKAESSIPFDLTNGPLLRIHLVKLGSNRHEVVFTAHHMICDGWSFGMILAELASAYNARKAGKLPRLAPAMSFAEYARREQANVNSPETTEAENYWISQFSEGSPVLDLPTDYPRPAMKTYAGAMESITLDASRYERLKKASPKLGGTLFATLLATFATLLHRLSGQEDVVIGVPAAGQTRIGRDELVGHCLNFLPLRLRPHAERSFNGFASEVKEQVLEAYDYQNYTFGSLLGKIKVERDSSRVPLVSVIFNIDKSGIDQIHLDGLKMDYETNPKQFVNFDLFFNLVQTDSRLVVECEYNTGLHNKETIRTWLASFEQIIESVIQNESGSLQDLDILPSGDRAILDQWNATSAATPSTPSIHRYFEEQVDRNPQGIALRAGERSFTYQELDRHANALAQTLIGNGVTRESLVAICAERRAETLVSILAVLKAGGAYVPIDPKYPRDRIAHILDDAKAGVLLTQRSLESTLPDSNACTKIYIDQALENSAERLAVTAQPSDLAYVIYTSGSTGLPKGVAIEHRNTIALIDWALGVFTPEDLAGVLFSTSICFDLSIFEMFVTLAAGGAVILAENALVLGNHPHRDRITLVNTVPSAISEILDAEILPPNTRVINLAGELLTQQLVERIYQNHSAVKVFDLYGPSEDTTYSTFTLRKQGGQSSIGRPISNTRAYVVSSRGKLLPPGMAGELLLGGDGLARGYLNRPELTAEKFIVDPFSGISGARLYKTGDLVKFHSNGELQYLGRLDHQVKLRGYRIELGEIESRLENHPAVEQAVANVHDGRLVAYIRQGSNEGSQDGTAIWEDQWDLLYKSAINQTGGDKLDRLDSVIAGWAGVDNLDAQVNEWIDITVERIGSYDTGRILEIGCGTGQILSRLAADAESYWGADISKVAIEALGKNHPLPQVKLLHRPADDFSDIPEGYFDTVIINSVAQYFPSAEYLVKVLEGASRVLKPGGRIFLGDIQSNALLATHHAVALSEHAPAGTLCSELREKISQRIAQETELSLDPEWFDAVSLPLVSHIEILLRRGKILNETTTYHYDVILHVGNVPATSKLPQATTWKNLNLEQLEATLTERSATFHFQEIPDKRLASAIAFRQSLESASSDSPIPSVSSTPANTVSAEDLFALASQCGYQAHVRWSGDGSSGMMEAVFIPQSEKTLPAWPKNITTRPASSLANTPKSSADPSGKLIATLRQHLTEQLPDYMVPSAFVMLDQFPLTPNGKIDRKALPSPSAQDQATAVRQIVAPRNPTETKLAEIWKQVLGNEQIGIEDDIFALGGDSILIFQITTRATRAGIAITPAQVFRLRTIAAICGEEASPKPASTTPTIQRVNRDAYRRNI